MNEENTVTPLVSYIWIMILQIFSETKDDVEVKAEPLSPLQNNCPTLEDVVISSVSLSPLLSRLKDYDMLSNNTRTVPCDATSQSEVSAEVGGFYGPNPQLSMAIGHQWKVDVSEEVDLGGLHVMHTEKKELCSSQAMERPLIPKNFAEGLESKKPKNAISREEQRLRRNELARKGMQRLRERRRINRLQQKLNSSQNTSVPVRTTTVGPCNMSENHVTEQAIIQRLGLPNFPPNPVCLKTSVITHKSPKEPIAGENDLSPKELTNFNKNLIEMIPQMQNYHKRLKDVCYHSATSSGTTTGLRTGKPALLSQIQHNSSQTALENAHQVWQNLVKNAEEKRRKNNQSARESMRRLRQQRRMTLFQQNVQQYNKMKKSVKNDMHTVDCARPKVQKTAKPQLLQQTEKFQSNQMTEEERLKRNRCAREGMRRLRERRRMAQMSKVQSADLQKTSVHSTLTTPSPSCQLEKEADSERHSQLVGAYDLGITQDKPKTQKNACALAVTKQNESPTEKHIEQSKEQAKKQVNPVPASVAPTPDANIQGRWLLPS
ncbi:uncharacterized protein [Watersipora subatra]|uniref:uncharacterized protein isoform X2 n=1 Tax=Watersipora subatra TaxID=2589382 RepID=UPI00355C8762